MTKEKMIGLFAELGWDKEQMRRFHQLFEKKHPAEHQSFLEWLGVPAREIMEIRKKSQ